MKKKRRILYLTTEVAPFTAESPLAEMSHHLTRIYRTAGHDIRVVVPKNSLIRDRKYNLREVIRLREIPVPISGKLTWVAVKSGFIPDTKVQVYFLEHENYFNREGITIDPATGKPYDDNDERYIVFCRAAVEMLKILSWQPQIIHCSDWTGALLGFYMRNMYAEDPFYQPTKVVLSLTNYRLIGEFQKSSVFKAGINPVEFKTGTDYELKGKFCFLKSGIIYSDLVVMDGSACIEGYPPHFLKWLRSYMKENPGKFQQIPVGLDHHIWNPDKDEKISANYNHREIEGKAENKSKLAEKYSLQLQPEAPLVGCIWNGTDYSPLKQIVEIVVENGGIFVIADKNSEEAKIEEFVRHSPENIGSVKLLTGLTIKQLMSGSDMLIVAPGKDSELLHLKSMKYGAVPIVPREGYFADFIIDSDEDRNGFLYQAESIDSLKDAVSRALELYKNGKAWTNLTKLVMKTDTTWNKAARDYQELYDTIT